MVVVSIHWKNTHYFLQRCLTNVTKHTFSDLLCSPEHIPLSSPPPFCVLIPHVLCRVLHFPLGPRCFSLGSCIWLWTRLLVSRFFCSIQPAHHVFKPHFDVPFISLPFLIGGSFPASQSDLFSPSYLHFSPTQTLCSRQAKCSVDILPISPFTLQTLL